MSAVLKVPTIFSAVDKFSSVVGSMSKSVGAFAGKTEAEVARVQRSFRNISDVSKKIAIGTGLVGAALLAPLAVAAKQAMNYETSIASLSAITGATGAQLQVFKSKVEDVGNSTKKSFIDVAKAFELAGSAMPELLGNADALAKVSEASIVLSKASGEELESSIRSLTGTMNQFSLGADQSQRTINVLAAGAKVGAASIAQTAESMVNFGSVAAGANMSVEQAVGAIQVMSKYSLFGAEAGTKLRGSLLKLQQAGLGYASGQFAINDALAEAKAKMDKLATAKQKDALLQKMFGAENISTGRILLSNIALLGEYTKGVTATSEANIQAGIKTNTAAEKYAAMQNQIQNLTIKIGEVLLPVLNKLADKILPVIESTVQWVKENPKLTEGIVKATAAIGALLLVVSGISTVVSIVTGFVATVSVLASAWVSVGAFITMNIIPAFQFLGAVFSVVVDAVLAFAGVSAGVFAAIAAAIAFVISLVFSFIRNWERITSAFKNDGIVAGLKAIGTTILDAILLPLQKVLELASKLPNFLGGGLAADAAAKVKDFRAGLGVTMTDETGSKAPAPAINTKKTNQDAIVSRTENTSNKNVTFDFKNVPKGLTVTGDGMSNSQMPALGSTFGM